MWGVRIRGLGGVFTQSISDFTILTKQFFVTQNMWGILMKKLSMLAAASVLAMSSAAHASDIIVKVKNVNPGEASANEDTATGTGPTAEGLGDVTVDFAGAVSGIDAKEKIDGFVLSDQRVLSEVNVAHEQDGLPAQLVAPGESVFVDISLSGAYFKERLDDTGNFRDGMMAENGFSEPALIGTLLSGGDVSQSSATIQYGAILQLPNQQVGTDLGMLLPLEIHTCDPENPVTLTVNARRGESDLLAVTPINSDGPVTIDLVRCEDSFGFEADGGTAKIDFQQDFKGFLSSEHDQADSIILGGIEGQIWNHIFDPKSDDEEGERIVDIDDIDSASIVVQFEDLTGIESVDLYDEGVAGELPTGTILASATLDLDTNTATFFLENPGVTMIADETRSIMAGLDLDHDEDTEEDILLEQTLRGYIGITAFGPDAPKAEEVPVFDEGKLVGTETVAIPGVGAIQHQGITIANVTYNFADPCKVRATNTATGGDERTAKFYCAEEIATDLPFANLISTGQQFGPFDWVSQGNGFANVWRVSHIATQDGHGNDRTVLKGMVTLKNSAEWQFDGDYKFELPFNVNQRMVGENGVYILNMNTLNNILVAQNGMPNALFGNTDVTWTFFTEVSPRCEPGLSTEGVDCALEFDSSLKIDVDRLMLTGGVLVPFGDNANDSNSSHSRSSDDGRFGPKSPLKKNGTAIGDITTGAIVDVITDLLQ